MVHHGMVYDMICYKFIYECVEYGYQFFPGMLCMIIYVVIIYGYGYNGYPVLRLWLG